MKLELIAVPVSDVDRSKAFYVDQVGFNADHDHRLNEQVRFVQLTPPGSACSITIGTGITDVEQMPWGARHAHFTDPDGNPWDLQEPTARS
jgi:catechol 2,3-dioxygenase-like lactoylglutathione lyase family enzyme